MKVIILSKSSYKEKDCIYNAISEEGYFSFTAKGAQDPKSKYVWLNNPLTMAEVDFLADGRYKYKVLNNAILLSSPMVSSDFDYLLSINIIAELAKKVLTDEEKHLLFKDIESALNALRSKKDHHMVILIFIAKLAKYGGAELEVDKCISCGSTSDIVAFSFEDGGFLCKNCLTEDTVRDLSGTQMHLLRYIFKAQDYSLPDINRFSLDDKKLILKKLRDFIDEFLGAKISSIDALLK